MLFREATNSDEVFFVVLKVLCKGSEFPQNSWESAMDRKGRFADKLELALHPTRFFQQLAGAQRTLV